MHDARWRQSSRVEVCNLGGSTGSNALACRIKAWLWIGLRRVVLLLAMQRQKLAVLQVGRGGRVERGKPAQGENQRFEVSRGGHNAVGTQRSRRQQIWTIGSGSQACRAIRGDRQRSVFFPLLFFFLLHHRPAPPSPYWRSLEEPPSCRRRLANLGVGAGGILVVRPLSLTEIDPCGSSPGKPGPPAVALTGDKRPLRQPHTNYPGESLFHLM